MKETVLCFASEYLKSSPRNFSENTHNNSCAFQNWEFRKPHVYHVNKTKGNFRHENSFDTLRLVCEHILAWVLYKSRTTRIKLQHYIYITLRRHDRLLYILKMLSKRLSFSESYLFRIRRNCITDYLKFYLNYNIWISQI